MDRKVDILMATYNGEPFIRQQISSIQNQTLKDWVLYIHDDGSTDSTVSIIRDMATHDERIVLIEDGISFHAPAPNFMHLLKYAQAEYVIFSDQDDIWLENKLQVTYDSISRESQDIPLAYYSNGYIYDSVTNEISGRSVLVPPRDLGAALFLNGGVQGCAIMINRKLREICLDHPDFICMHDHLITLAALTFGRMVYIDQKLMLYRRHCHAVTDVSSRGYKDKIILFFQKKKPIIDGRHFKAIQAFYEHYSERIPEQQKVLFVVFLKMVQMNFFSRFWTILKYPFSLYNSKQLLLCKLFLRPFKEF